MKFCPKCCSFPGACGDPRPTPFGRAPILYGGEGWVIEPWSPGGTAPFQGDIIVSIEGSTSIYNAGDPFYDIMPHPGGCCPCLNGEWTLTQGVDCRWYGGMSYTTGSDPPLPPGCDTEAMPCAPGGFGGACHDGNSGWITMVFWAGISGTGPGSELYFNLGIDHYMQALGWGYVCAFSIYARKSVIPAPEYPTPYNIVDWVEMDERPDGYPFTGERFCGWTTWYNNAGDPHDPTATIKFKAAA